MKNRNGEKMGWIGGWLGSFLWVLVLSVVFLFQGKRMQGIVGLVLVVLGVFYVFSSAPWRRPEAPYWKLMIRIYAVFLTAVAWAIWSFGGWQEVGPSWWNFFWILPVLLPLFTAGRRTWNDFPPGTGEKGPIK